MVSLHVETCTFYVYFRRAGSATNPVVAASSGSPATYGPPSAAPQVQKQHHEHWNRGGGSSSSNGNANHYETMQADLSDLYADFDALSESMSRRPAAATLPAVATSSPAIKPTASGTHPTLGNYGVSEYDNGSSTFANAFSPYFSQESAERGWQQGDSNSAAARLASGSERSTANICENVLTPNYVRLPLYGVDDVRSRRDDVRQNNDSAAAVVTVHDANGLLQVQGSYDGGQGSSDGGRWPVDYHEVDNGSPSWPAVAGDGSARPPPPPPPLPPIAEPRTVPAADRDAYILQPPSAPSPPGPPPALSPSPAIAKNLATTRFGSAKVKTN
jgi:hypothetical protein